MSADDVSEHCSLTKQQLEQIREASGRQEKNALALAVQVVNLISTGKQPEKAAALPPALLKYLCQELNVYRVAPTIAALKTIYDSEHILRRHREVARSIAGFEQFDDSTEADLRKTLGLRAIDASSVDELYTLAEQWLYDRQRVIPGERALRDIARDAFKNIEELALRTVRAAVSASRLKMILKVMFEESLKPKVTILEWLRQSVGKHNVKNMNKVSARIEYLRELGVDTWDLSAISINRIRGFALNIVHRPPSESARRIEDTLAVELVCFLKYVLAELSDEQVYRFNRRTGDLVRSGRKNVQKKQAAQSTAFRESMQAMRVVAGDTTQTPSQRLKAITDMMDEMLGTPSVSTAEVVRESIAGNGSRVNTLLKDVECLSINGDPDSKDLKIVQALQQLKESGAKELPADFDTSIVDPSWMPYVTDTDRTRALDAFKGYATTQIRHGLIGGRLHVSHSSNFRSHDDMLIPHAEWEANKDTICDSLGLPRHAREYLAPHYALLTEGLAKMATEVQRGIVEIDNKGSVRIDKFRALEDDPDLVNTKQSMSNMIGPVELPDLMLEIDSKTKFSTILLGREANNADELIALYGGLLAHGTDVDAKGAAAMIPGIRPNDISSAMRMLETPGRLRAANDAIVAFQQSHAIVKLWSDGKKASADMMSLDATKHLAQARQEPRRKSPAVGLYTHVLGSYAIIHDMPIVLMSRQNGPAVEGVERYNTGEDRIKVELLAVDTHGYTYPAMSVAKLLRFDLCPQLAGLPDCRLWVPRGVEIPDSLERVVLPTISEKAIVDAWDGILRLIASIKLGKVSVSWALARNGSAARGAVVQRGLDQLGRLLRTIFLCDYMTNPEFRRELHTLLNRGESVHQLQRAIHFGRLAPERGRRSDELKTISGAHALMTNMVIAWNTAHEEEVIAKLRAAGDKISDELVRHIGPVWFGNINMRGTMSFRVERYADILLKPRAGAAKTARK